MTVTFYDCATAPSPRRARMVLGEKVIAHERVEVDLGAGAHFSDAFRAVNPRCTVPALVLEDGTVLADNAGIAAWADAAFPDPPLLGVTPQERGAVAEWTARLEFEGLHAFMETLRNGSPRMADRALPGAVNYAQIPELAERGRERLMRFFDMLDARLAGREFIAADQFSVADIIAVVLVDVTRMVKLRPLETHGEIARWRAALDARASLHL